VRYPPERKLEKNSNGNEFFCRRYLIHIVKSDSVTNRRPYSLMIDHPDEELMRMPTNGKSSLPCGGGMTFSPVRSVSNCESYYHRQSVGEEKMQELCRFLLTGFRTAGILQMSLKREDVARLH